MEAVATFLVLGWIAAIYYALRGKAKRPGRPVSLTIFWPDGKDASMSKQTLHTDDNGTSATLVFKDKKGNVTTPATPPVWSTTVDGIVDLEVADDGMSAAIAVLGQAGSTDINVVAEGDPVAGVDTLHATGTVEVLPAEAATVDLSFGPVN